jgi:hypothetical protein
MSGSPSSGLRSGSGQSCRRPGHEDALTSVAFPPEEALVAACALLRHSLVRVEPGTPKGKWLDELASVVGKACLRPGAQGSRTIAGGPSRADSWSSLQQSSSGRSHTGGSCDLRSRLDEKRAGENARTIL